MTLIAKHLDSLRKKHEKRRFSAITTLKIGIQLMSAFKKLHNLGFIHRDVKPQNMAPGFQRRNVIYLFDFGLARYIYTDGQKRQLRTKRSRVS